jgi:murein DD-endopeptidase MepM/ murein hydrolase activator NlpD
MANGKVNNSTQKKPASMFANTALGRWLHAVFGRIFCKRSIIIIAQHKTKHVPFSAGTQIFGLLGLICVITWASYSSGSYMAAQRILEEKEQKLASTARENMRVSAEFTLLKSDLMKLASASKTGKSADVAKQLADQYSSVNSSTPNAADVVGDDVHSQYEAVFKRVEYLDNKVRELQTTHDEMMSDIKTATGGKIKELERVIARTGMGPDSLEKAAAAKRNEEEARKEKYGRIQDAAGAKGNKSAGGQGGPFVPVRESALKSRETELYFSIKRLMTLNDVVTALPLDVPIAGKNYKQTSGFGVRSDPFRGSSAFHSGVDFAGPEHAKVVATNDGRVEFAGWNSSYGNVVDIKHEYGLATRYAHLERLLVQPEQVVKKGQVIGIQGSTGRSTGHHLHYEVRYQGRAINPNNFLKAGADVRSVN